MRLVAFVLILAGLVFALVAGLMRPLTPEQITAWGVAVGAPEVGK